MNINSTNVNFSAKTILPKKNGKLKVEEGELSGFFRDKELFNPEKDKVNFEYFKYDVDDCQLHVKDRAFPLKWKSSVYMFDEIG